MEYQLGRKQAFDWLFQRIDTIRLGKRPASPFH